ncbi:MAG: membrane protein insertase YidC, partial [Ekhidna sp.]
MDRNQFIGLILMFALLAVYFTWFAPDPPVPEELTTQTEPVQETIAEVSSDTTTVIPDLPDSVQESFNSQKYGAFAFAAGAEERVNTIENEELIITLTNQGGRIKDVILKKHKDYLGN